MFIIDKDAVLEGENVMSEIKQVKLTAEGLEKLEKELEYLKVVKRKEVSARIKEAMSYGDLSENSEYDEAKEEQARVENKIASLENDLKHAVVIDVTAQDNSTVYIGCKVKLFDYEFDEEVEYCVVGSKEADVRAGKISDASPIGKALIGKALNEEFELVVGDEKFKYKVLEISRA